MVSKRVTIESFTKVVDTLVKSVLKQNHRWVGGQKTVKMHNVICERPLIKMGGYSCHGAKSKSDLAVIW